MILANKRIWSAMLIILALMFMYDPCVGAATADNTSVGTIGAAQIQDDPATLQNVRFSSNSEETRIVLDLNRLPQYTLTILENPTRIVIDLSNTENGGVLPARSFKDSLLTQIRTATDTEKRTRIVLELANLPYYEVFTLKNPDRLVIDLRKIYEQKTEEVLADGLRHITIRKGTKNGPLVLHVLDYDMNSQEIKLEHVLANDEIPGLETVSSMAKRTNALAAINGTYFAKSGELLGLLLYNDNILQSPIGTRSAFALKHSGELIIDQVSYAGEIELPSGARCPIQALNRERGLDSVVIYTPAFGSTTKTNDYGMEYIVIEDKITEIRYGNAAIPTNGYVVSVHGACMKKMADLEIGDRLIVRHKLDPNWTDVRLAVGAGPQLVKDGNIYLTTKTEGFGNDIVSGRAPRSAIGITPDRHLLLAVVDGRQPAHSVGMTLLELAKFMQELGVTDAMNLDGGGSTELVVMGEIANRPSDGKERLLGDALIFVPSVNPTPAVTITILDSKTNLPQLNEAKKAS
jgi:exopolysaccharide biosynthesis protein